MQEVTIKKNLNNAGKIADRLMAILPKKELKKLSRIKRFTQYKDKPVEFAEEIFGDHFTDDIKRLMESVRDNAITVARSGNSTGKTHCAARIAAWYFLCHEDSQVFTTAPTEEHLKGILWGQIGDLIAKHQDIFDDKTQNVMNIIRNPISFLKGVTIPTSGPPHKREATFSGKHAPHTLFIVDDGDAVPDEVYRGIESCMSGGHARLLIMLNPRMETGYTYHLERDGLSSVVQISALNHPNVIIGRNVINGAVTREVTVQRINKWTVPVMDGRIDGQCFQVPEYLVGATCTLKGRETSPLRPGYRKIIEPAFAYMVIAEYPQQAINQLISRDWIYNARCRWDLYVSAHGITPPEGTKAVQGLDVAELGNDANVSYLRYGTFIMPAETWGGVDMAMTEDRAMAICQMAPGGVDVTNVDATGIGAGVAPHMRRAGFTAVPVKVSEGPTKKCELGEFGNLRDEIWWTGREWLRTNEGAMLPPDEMLLEELAAATYETRNGKIKVLSKDIMKEILKRSPDHADAFLLTLYEGRAKKAKVYL